MVNQDTEYVDKSGKDRKMVIDDEIVVTKSNATFLDLTRFRSSGGRRGAMLRVFKPSNKVED